MRIISCLCIFLISIILTSCTSRQEQSKCDIKDLLLEKTDFPGGTIVNDVSSPVAEYPTESANFTANFQQDLMYQVVGRYSSIKNAERKFTERLEQYFKGDDFEGPWETPIEIS